MNRTGSTHGIKLRIKPPAKAKASASQIVRSSAGGGGSVTFAGACAGAAAACSKAGSTSALSARARLLPPSSKVRTPSVAGVPTLKAVERVRISAPFSIGCSAACSISVSRIGKKRISLAPAGRPGRVSVSLSSPFGVSLPVKPAGFGRAARACSIRVSTPASTTPVAAIGRSSVKAPSSGMQIFSQTSQVALAESESVSPGLALAGTLISTGSRTLSSKPKLTSGSTRIALGAGHWIAPALTPSGSVHSIRVASPESPGFCQ